MQKEAGEQKSIALRPLAVFFFHSDRFDGSGLRDVPGKSAARPDSCGQAIIRALFFVKAEISPMLVYLR